MDEIQDTKVKKRHLSIIINLIITKTFKKYQKWKDFHKVKKYKDNPKN